MSRIVIHENLPGIIELKKRLTTLSILDVIMIPTEDDWLRVHKKVEDPDGSLDIFEIDHGAGDSLFILFSEKGCIIKGFDHESFFSPYAREDFHVWTGIYDETPEYLVEILNDPLFEKDVVTFCIWRNYDDPNWLQGSIENPDNDDDGFEFLCGFIAKSAADYCNWAEVYFDKEMPVNLVEQVYSGTDINSEIIKAINPSRDVDEALTEIGEIIK